jgi:hypothetical protein
LFWVIGLLNKQTHHSHSRRISDYCPTIVTSKYVCWNQNARTESDSPILESSLLRTSVNSKSLDLISFVSPSILSFAKKEYGLNSYGCWRKLWMSAFPPRVIMIQSVLGPKLLEYMHKHTMKAAQEQHQRLYPRQKFPFYFS